MPAYADRVKDTTTTTGTGNITLAGSAPTGFRTFAAAFGASGKMFYAISSSGGSEWEVGYGTLSGSTTLARTIVLASSNSNNLVNFSAGTKDVFCTVPAGGLVEVSDTAPAASGPGRFWWNSTDGNLYISYDDGTSIQWVVAFSSGAFLYLLNIGCTIDGGGAAITTGIKGEIGPFEFACTIEAVTLLADQSGSIVIDIWKDSYANYPPTDADSITASAPPTLSSAIKSQDGTLTGWTKTIAIGDILRFNVDSITTCQRVTLSMKVKRT